MMLRTAQQNSTHSIRQNAIYLVKWAKLNDGPSDLSANPKEINAKAVDKNPTF